MNQQKTSIDMLTHLVAFDTTSALSNMALIEFVQSYLHDFNVDSTLTFNTERNKANLYATIGPPDKPGIALSGHTDVVPTKGQRWDHDPYSLTEVDGHLFGRGACDMKGFIACVLAAVPAMCSAALQTPVHLAFSYDEEVGCLGVRRMLDMMRDLPVLPAMAIIGEPTLMQPMIGHKGKRAYRITVTGNAGHSAYAPEAVNAVAFAAELITEIYAIQRSIQEQGPFDEDYRVPYTTLHVGTIHGGTALNIVPELCTLDVEIRHLAQHDPADITQRIRHFSDHSLLPRMQRLNSQASIEFEELQNYPGLYTAPSERVVRYLQQWLDEAATPSKVSFGTEAGLFSSMLDIPSVVCGPGSIQQAHKANEYVSLEQLHQCDAMLSRMIDSLRTP